MTGGAPPIAHSSRCVCCAPPPGCTQVRCQRVIYGLLEDVGGLLVGASPKVEHEVVAGAAEVLQTFALKGSR